jgi:hypothetical protein
MIHKRRTRKSATILGQLPGADGQTIREREMEVGATIFVVLTVFAWLNVGGLINF